MVENTNTNAPLSRAESSRINGAKSRGPVTPEGKQRSSFNRTTHGAYSTRVVLCNESQEAFNELLSQFVHLFQPRDDFEKKCVNDMVNAQWRANRLEAAGAANLELALAEARTEFEAKYENLGATHELALAFRIAQSAGHSDGIARHEDRQHRLFDKAYRLLAKHRSKHGALLSLQPPSEAQPELDFTPSNPLETQPDTQNEAFEPEIAPPSPPAPSNPPPRVIAYPKSPKSEPLHDPPPMNCVGDDDYRLLKPIFEALQDHPDLRIAVSEAILEHRARAKPDRAA